MDIMVEGRGLRYYRPEEVEISLNFYTKTNSYETALENGTRDVQIFISEILGKMNFEKDNLKTRSFRVYEETRYDYERKVEIKCGFAYTQSATLKFDYNIDVVAEFMEKTSKLSNPPKYTIGFTVKNIQESKNEALADAYNMAREKAEAIAKAAGKTLKECIKTDFRPFEESVNSRSELDGSFATRRIGADCASTRMTAQEIITNIFTPEDIEVSEKLYCLWITN